MPRKWVWPGAMLIFLAVSACVAAVAEAADQPKQDTPSPEPTRSPNLEQLLPRWELGDRWVVETVSRPLQVRRGAVPTAMSRSIQWQFAVQRFEKSLTNDCYRVEVRCLAQGAAQPQTVLWIDKKSLALRQIETQIPVPGGFRTMTMNYAFSSGQPSPVLGPLTALPIDLPSFLGGQAKGTQTFTYESHTGPPGRKELGELGFAHKIEQQVTAVSSENVKGLVPEEFAKSLTSRPVTEVRLKGAAREVRQLWQPGQPWPVYCDNGSTECRLLKVLPADGSSKESREPQP